MTDPLILFVATAGSKDISIARREPDGTLRRAEYANIKWLEALSRNVDNMIALNPEVDLTLFNQRMYHELGNVWLPPNRLDLESHVSGYFTAMKRYHGSDWSSGIAGVGYDIREMSEAIGVPVQSYDPGKNSTNRLNWTMRLWERTKE